MLYSFFCQIMSHQWLTEGEWHFIFLFQALSSSLNTCRVWVTLYFFFCLAVSSCLMAWPTEGEWALFFCQAVSSVSSTISMQWVTLHFSFAKQFHYAITSMNRMWDSFVFFFQAVSSSWCSWHRVWVMLHPFLCQAVSSCLIPWSTGGEWHGISCFSRKSHHV